ncbi:hypothetical protein O181_065276 [Austropuccinia psidii MF-1]|uniref:Uncharacterized protein n=1 Tax=Austropuccinia psidii MF-1 TaxID=1389203 RepID=A0A9Q3EVB7_9BASI|nr:hypothetical protein [Austropuccinia psidii MF-1]
MSPVHLRNLGVPRKQTEDREGLSRTRRPGRGHLGHSGRWQDTEGNHTHLSIHFSIQQKFQTRALEQYGSHSSAQPTAKRSLQWSMDTKRLNLTCHWEELGASCQKICLKEINFKDLMEITKHWNPTRKFRHLEERATRIRENQATIVRFFYETLDNSSNIKSTMTVLIRKIYYNKILWKQIEYSYFEPLRYDQIPKKVTRNI